MSGDEVSGAPARGAYAPCPLPTSGPVSADVGSVTNIRTQVLGWPMVGSGKQPHWISHEATTTWIRSLPRLAGVGSVKRVHALTRALEVPCGW
jgi:hypothetical protein